MVKNTRVTYRRRHCYNTKSNKIRKVKTPGTLPHQFLLVPFMLRRPFNCTTTKRTLFLLENIFIPQKNGTTWDKHRRLVQWTCNGNINWPPRDLSVYAAMEETECAPTTRLYTPRLSNDPINFFNFGCNLIVKFFCFNAHKAEITYKWYYNYNKYY